MKSSSGTSGALTARAKAARSALIRKAVRSISSGRGERFTIRVDEVGVNVR